MAKRFSEEQFQEYVVSQFSSIDGRFTSVEAEIKEVKNEITEIKDILHPLAKAFDIDSETLVQHDRRLNRVENHLGLTQA